MINTVIQGRYKIIEEIGHGGMATVYKAEDTKYKNIVAIKILKEEYLTDNNFLERFKREAEASLHLSHSNIVKAFDVGQTETLRYIVMEYVDGITLKEYIEQKKRLSVDESLDIAIRIASALKHAHVHGIVHRDIKPQNILLSTNGMVKVADFGIARATSTTTLTIGDTGVLGSVHYFSPEQARGRKVRAQSDIYSLGMVLYEMLTGQLPYKGESVVEIALKHIEEDVALTDENRKYVPSKVWKVITKATERKVEERYQSASIFSAELKRVKKDPGKIIKEKVVNNLEETKVLPRIGANIEFENKKAEQTTRMPKKMIFAIILGVIIVIVLCVIFMISVLNKNINFQKRSMENLVGLSYQEVEELLQDYSHEIYITKQEYSDLPVGDVIAQTPEQGEIIRNGESIYIQISKGTEKKPIVDVRGDWKSQAVNKLKDSGFNNIKIIYEPSIRPKNIVIDQNPVHGQKVNPDIEIVIVVSDGMNDNQTFVNKYIGLPVEEAKSQIEEDALTVGEIGEEHSEEVSSGKITRQFPENGHIVDKETAVDLWISLGQEPLVNKKIKLEIVSGQIIDPAGLEVLGNTANEDEEKELEIVDVEQQENTLIIELRGSGEYAFTVLYKGLEIGTGDIVFNE